MDEYYCRKLISSYLLAQCVCACLRADVRVRVLLRVTTLLLLLHTHTHTQVELEEEPWFEEGFPDGLELRHAYETFLLLPNRND